MKSRRKKTANAVEILHRRYVGDDPARKAALEELRSAGPFEFLDDEGEDIYTLEDGELLEQEGGE